MMAHSWLDTALILAILLVDIWMLADQRVTRKLYEEFFRERTRWYASRGRSPRRGKTGEADAAGGELVRPEVRREVDGGRDGLRPLGADCGEQNIALLDEVEAVSREELGEGLRDSAGDGSRPVGSGS